MVAQCATAAVLFGAGDVIAQQVIEKKGKEHDVRVLSKASPPLLRYIPSHSENMFIQCLGILKRHEPFSYRVHRLSHANSSPPLM
jgi:hypothetical protein